MALPTGREESRQEKERKMIPFFVEFVKFTTGFATIIALALFTLHLVSTTG